MLNHVVVLAAMNIARGLLGLAIGAYFVYCSDRSNVPQYRHERIEDWDWTAFLVVGVIVLVFAILRMIQGVSTLVDLRRTARGAAGAARSRLQLGRRLGYGLAIFDLLNIALFPFSTPCGLYGFLVYRHADTVDFYEGRLAAKA